VSGVDALRGLAALGVFVCHLVAYWRLLGLPFKLVPVSQVGAHGVDVFVVLSGFCLALPLAARGGAIDVRQFFGRRAWRILPAYWVALALATVLAIWPLTWPHTVARQADAWDVIVHVLGLQTVFTPTLGAINGSLWSISLELSLYVAFPLALWVWKRAGARALVVMACAVCAGWFLLGRVHHRRFPLRRIAPVTAGSVLVATAATTWEAPEELNLILWALAGGTLVYLFSSLDQNVWLRRGDAWGRRSFSFYLVHQPTLLLLAPLSVLLPGGETVHLVLGGLLALGIVSGVAEVLYRAVEQPSHRRGRGAFPHPVRRPPLPKADSHVSGRAAGGP
jgi:exopolysaccharide production protein ExoZ